MRSEDRTGLTPWLLWDFLRLLSGAETIAHMKNTGSAMPARFLYAQNAPGSA